jgi:hypothetical protein
LTWDTRDREIGSLSGTWADPLVQRVDKTRARPTTPLDSDCAPLPQPLGSRVTLANRLLVQNTTGGVPFFVLGEIQTTQKPQDGLGGSSSVRGLPKDRFVGKGIALANNELRWRAAEFSLHGRPSSIVLSAFADAGRVWSDGIHASTAFSDVHARSGPCSAWFRQQLVVAVMSAFIAVDPRRSTSG